MKTVLSFDLVTVDYLSLIGVLALPSWVCTEAAVVAASVLKMVLGKNRAKRCQNNLMICQTWAY